jgi:hypothetical protein
MHATTEELAISFIFDLHQLLCVPKLEITEKLFFHDYRIPLLKIEFSIFLKFTQSLDFEAYFSFN